MDAINFVQGQTINYYHIRQNKSRFWCLPQGFGSTLHSAVSSKYLRHYIVGKIRDDLHFCKVKQSIDIIFDKIYDFWCLP